MFTKFYIESPDSFFYVQVVEVAVKNMLVLRWNQRAHYWFWGSLKGHSALWKKPSENTVIVLHTTVLSTTVVHATVL